MRAWCLLALLLAHLANTSASVLCPDLLTYGVLPMSSATLINRVHDAVLARAQGKPKQGKGPLIVGGIPGSGTRASMEIFHRLGVIAWGDRQWDSRLCIGASMPCERSLDFTLNDVDPDMRRMHNVSFFFGMQRFLREYPGLRRCRFHMDKTTTSPECDRANLPTMQDIIDSGKPWGFKQPHCYRHVPYLQESYPDHTFVHVVRDGKDAFYSSMSSGQLNCYGIQNFTQNHVIDQWGRVNTELAQWAEKRAYGESFFIIRTEDLAHSSSDDTLVPLLQRIVRSVGIMDVTEDKIRHELAELRANSLGSHTIRTTTTTVSGDTVSTTQATTNAYGRKMYTCGKVQMGKWRRHRALYASEGTITEEGGKGLRAFGYQDKIRLDDDRRMQGEGEEWEVLMPPRE